MEDMVVLTTRPSEIPKDMNYLAGMIKDLDCPGAIKVII